MIPTFSIGRHRIVGLVAGFVLWAVVAAIVSPHAQAAIFTVTTPADTEDPNDGFVSLREAINAANANPGPDVIEFQIDSLIFGPPPHFILVGDPLGFPLPHIIDQVVIDGTTAPGYVDTPLVLLIGEAVLHANPIYRHGLHFEGNADGSEVRGLTIRNFPGIGVSLYNSNITIEGNAIDGNGADPNVTTGGILISYEVDNQILNNVISGNHGDGISIGGDLGLGNNLVQGNVIAGNTGHGLAIRAPQTSVFDNVIWGNAGIGVEIVGYAAVNNEVKGNFIGTDEQGTAHLGNGQQGVRISGGPLNTVRDNVISGNTGVGLEILGSAVISTVVRGNFIGTDTNGTELGNGEHGVKISGASHSTIGGFDFRRGSSVNYAANVIAHNGGDGVHVASGENNSIRGNSIFRNGGLGIDLGEDGVDPNDFGDPDTGANRLQNAPVLKSAFTFGNTTTVQLELASAISAPYHFDFYVNDEPDPSGYGEGQAFIHTIFVTSPGYAHTLIVLATLPAVATGKFITATATSEANTSEFSNALKVLQRYYPIVPRER